MLNCLRSKFKRSNKKCLFWFCDIASLQQSNIFILFWYSMLYTTHHMSLLTSSAIAKMSYGSMGKVQCAHCVNLMEKRNVKDHTSRVHKGHN